MLGQDNLSRGQLVRMAVVAGALAVVQTHTPRLAMHALHVKRVAQGCLRAELRSVAHRHCVGARVLARPPGFGTGPWPMPGMVIAVSFVYCSPGCACACALLADPAAAVSPCLPWDTCLAS
jgi:hypothetical protein